ncbi:hypothetical protein ElyMa_007073100 [Elysia marginata]|uniref:Uncharacterized protein n=1 Tax=Elysia marginata TaxID=1093978 RepID=A0AAV4JX52_9GAST|nr:hypothetical protein ElyMa_007073100 [Elysia marginata]
MERHRRERYIRDKYSNKYYKSNGYHHNNSSCSNRASDGGMSSSASSHSISSNCSTGSTNSCSKLDRWSLHQIRRDDQSQWYHSYTCPVYDSNQRAMGRCDCLICLARSSLGQAWSYAT